MFLAITGFDIPEEGELYKVTLASLFRPVVTKASLTATRLCDILTVCPKIRLSEADTSISVKNNAFVHLISPSELLYIK